jgi:predicted HTH transcriptional regulator
VITNREYREAFNVSHKTAHLELTMLEEKKLVKSEGAGRSTRYISPRKIEE